MSRILSPLFITGQYYETCDGSSSSVTINTSNIPLGAEVMEVMVYRKRERRKYSPLTNDNSVFFVTGGDRVTLYIRCHLSKCINRTNTVQAETKSINNV